MVYVNNPHLLRNPRVREFITEATTVRDLLVKHNIIDKVWHGVACTSIFYD